MKTWHFIKSKCDCEISQWPIADELGEDINAWEEIKRYREDEPICENCKKKIKYILIRTKN